MASVGPQLPPHLASKRKATDNGPDTITNPPKRSKSSSDDDEGNIKRRVIGPSRPPADISEQPVTDPTPDANDSSSSDDDFGPSLPPAIGSHSQAEEAHRQKTLQADLEALEASKKPQRESWMLVPPKQDDLSSRADPTKIKPRKFNAGKGAKAPMQRDSGSNALWTETPEQKRQRLEDEVMGVKKPAQLGESQGGKKEKWREEEDRATERRIREYNEKNRKESLMKEHKKVVPKEKEDDPSKRAFDREKDVGLGVKIGHRAKGEMVAKAKDFGGRFAGGNYL